MKRTGTDVQKPKPRAFLERTQAALVMVTCAILIAAGLRAMVTDDPSAVPPPAAPVSLEGAPTLGNNDAAVVLVIYSDYECPYCVRFAHETWPRLRADYVDTGKLLVAYRHLPLDQIHRNARPAAIAATCAHMTGEKFWEMNDLLFQDRRRLDKAALVERAESLGLDTSSFLDCLSGPAVQRVADDANQARQLGLTSTPSFLIGTRADGSVTVIDVVKGAQSVDVFTGKLNQALSDGGWKSRVRGLIVKHFGWAKPSAR